MNETTTTAHPTTDPHRPHDPHDPRAVLATAIRIGGETIAAVRPDQLHRPTPCTDYDVEQLLGHMVFALHNLTRVGRGEAHHDVSYFSDSIDGDWVATWAAASREAQDVWSDPAKFEQLHEFAFATLPGVVALAIYASEVTTHTWDLARAIDVAPAWDDHVITVALRAMTEGLPAEPRGGEMPFGPVVAIAADAPLVDQLVAWTGRRP